MKPRSDEANFFVAFRKKRRLTQMAAAKRATVSHQTLSLLERGIYRQAMQECTWRALLKFYGPAVRVHLPAFITKRGAT